MEPPKSSYPFEEPGGTRHPADTEGAKAAASVQASAGVMVLVAWWLGASAGSTLSRLDALGLPLVGGAFMAAAWLTWTRPSWLLAVRKVLLGLVFTYAQASLFVALFMHPSSVDGPAVTRLALGLPMLYLAAFLLPLRRAYALPVALAAMTAAQAAMCLAVKPGPLAEQAHQTLVLLMAAQPVYLALFHSMHLQRMQQLAAQEAAANAKMALVAMISHELRSPLQTIVSALNALQRRLALSNLPPAELQNLHRIRSSSAQLDSHLSDLIVVTKRAQGLAPPRPEPFRLDMLLHALVDNYRGAAHDRGNLLELQIADDCRMVVGDGLRVQQIVNNLLNNAVKYTQDGQIALSAARVNGGERVRLTVSDSGIGVAPDKAAAIWEPYVRLTKDPRVALAQGSGLGLAVVRFLVDMLGGEIEFDSRPGQGTRAAVTLALPVTAGE